VKPVRLRLIAKRDLREAVAWYRERDPELANRFLDEVYRALGLLEQFPNTGGPVFGTNDPDIRKLPIDNFPYQIVFKKLKHRVSVLAIADVTLPTKPTVAIGSDVIAIGRPTFACCLLEGLGGSLFYTN